MREKKPKAGRPKFAKGEARSVVLQTRVQPDERKAYQKAATAKGLELSVWVRQTLNQAIL